jgi:hypothetical protein
MKHFKGGTSYKSLGISGIAAHLTKKFFVTKEHKGSYSPSKYPAITET